MKTKLLLIAVACLLICSATSYAQPPALSQDERANQRQQIAKMELTSGIKSLWSGQNMMTFGLLQDPNIRAVWDMSDEQFLQISLQMSNMQDEMAKNPEYRELMGEVNAILRQYPYMQNLDEETQMQMMTIGEKITTLRMSFVSDVIDNAITPEQKQKINESLLANMEELSFVLPSMFEALGLSDAQRQQMVNLKKELEPEFEKHLEHFVNGQAILERKIFEERDRQRRLAGVSENSTGIERIEDRQAIQKKLLEEDPEYKRIHEEVQSQGKAFVTQFKTKMFDVLTDAQWIRLQELVDNPPEYAKALGIKLRELRGERERADGAWVPGPGSWRPGDPIPAQYRQERETRRGFPRGEN